MAGDGVSRRHFFVGTLLAGAVPSGGFGSVASLKALGYKSFNEKLNLAGIGVGGRGAQDLSGCSSENIVALCDVDSRQAAPSFKRWEKAARYTDFRKMLDKEASNIDAVVIATADHMHATAALWCMQRGKSVYVEKPLTRTPWEARLLADAAAKYKVATQMGNQGYSHEAHRTACEIVWSGEIGNVTEVHAVTSAPSWPQGIQAIPQEEPVPEGLEWDLWLGGAAMRSYTSGGWDKEHAPTGSSSPGGFYLPFNWRGFYDFGTGSLGDWGIHTLGPANQALQLGAPIAVECVRAEQRSQFTFPLRSVLRYDFAARGNMPPVSVYWYDGVRGADLPYLYHPKGLENEALLPSSNNLAAMGRPDLGSMGGRGGRGSEQSGRGGAQPGRGGAQAGRGAQPQAGRGGGRGPALGVLTGSGSIFVGDKGYMATVARGEGVQLLPAAKWAEYSLPAPVLPRSPGHYRDWIRACKGGEPACSNFGVAGPFAEWVTLGAIAYRFEGKLLYDAKTQRFTNNQEANKYIKPLFRRGWEIKL
ncbi:MAG: Gfo/Idh/MocA family oxidoreductase [Acidobacteriia bacterium]|nr:Gfo/Idh/MocA family oxidoreductase [Terriglobia bacterium]